MRLYRIADRRFGPENGEGARLYGGRWNSPGREVIYTSTSYAGSMLEKLVHTGRRIPKHQVCVTFDVPDGLTIAELPPSSYHGWNAIDHAVCRKAGDAWLETRASVILLVPSVVFEVERNALIHPAHPEAKRIRVLSVESIRWDDRLFG